MHFHGTFLFANTTEILTWKNIFIFKFKIFYYTLKTSKILFIIKNENPCCSPETHKKLIWQLIVTYSINLCDGWSWISPVVFIFSAVVIRLQNRFFNFRYVLMQSPQFLYYSIHFLNYCYFLHHGGDISHSVCFFFCFCIAKEYKETALGFCMKCMTLSKHWNDLCKLKRGLFAFFFFYLGID